MLSVALTLFHASLDCSWIFCSFLLQAGFDILLFLFSLSFSFQLFYLRLLSLL